MSLNIVGRLCLILHNTLTKYARPCIINQIVKELTVSPDPTAQRMEELMRPVDQQIMMCDSREDVLMMACAMMQRAREIFDNEIGEQHRKSMFRDLS
jgi:hypothetical protein